MDIMSTSDQAFLTWRLVILASLSLVIIISNVFCVVVVRRGKDIKKMTRIFMMSMSIADLGMGVLTLPLQFLSLIVNMEPSVTETLCVVHITMHTLLSGTSLLCVLLMTLERYLAVEFPLRHRSLVTTRRAYIAVACAWLVCCANATVAGSLAATTDNFHDECGTCLSVSTHFNHHFEWFQIGANVVVPLVFIITIYARILILVRRHVVRREVTLNSLAPGAGNDRRPPPTAQPFFRSKSFAMRKKSLCTFLMVVSTYLLTCIPSATIMILAISGYHISAYAIEAARYTVYCYSWLNVLVYCLRNATFIEAAKSFLRCR